MNIIIQITEQLFTGAVKFLVVQIDTFLVFTINLEGRSGIFHHSFQCFVFNMCSVHLQMVLYWFKCHKQKYYCFEYAFKCKMCSLQIELWKKNITELQKVSWNRVCIIHKDHYFVLHLVLVYVHFPCVQSYHLLNLVLVRAQGLGFKIWSVKINPQN